MEDEDVARHDIERLEDDENNTTQSATAHKKRRGELEEHREEEIEEDSAEHQRLLCADGTWNARTSGSRRDRACKRVAEARQIPALPATNSSTIANGITRAAGRQELAVDGDKAGRAGIAPLTWSNMEQFVQRSSRPPSPNAGSVSASLALVSSSRAGASAEYARTLQVSTGTGVGLDGATEATLTHTTAEHGADKCPVRAATLVSDNKPNQAASSEHSQVLKSTGTVRTASDRRQASSRGSGAAISKGAADGQCGKGDGGGDERNDEYDTASVTDSRSCYEQRRPAQLKYEDGYEDSSDFGESDAAADGCDCEDDKIDGRVDRNRLGGSETAVGVVHQARGRGLSPAARDGKAVGWAGRPGMIAGALKSRLRRTLEASFQKRAAAAAAAAAAQTEAAEAETDRPEPTTFEDFVGRRTVASLAWYFRPAVHMAALTVVLVTRVLACVLLLKRAR